MQKMIIPKEERVDPFFLRKQNKTAINKDSIEGMTRETDKMVTGTFINVECPGQPAKICCKYYKNMPYFSDTFHDNERRTIPLSVARHINERCFFEEQKYILDESGAPLKNPKPRHRYKFVSENY